jgi:hypothetical protein
LDRNLWSQLAAAFESIVVGFTKPVLAGHANATRYTAFYPFRDLDLLALIWLTVARYTLEYSMRKASDSKATMKKWAYVNCKMCGKKFDTAYPTRAKYCSNACALRFYRRMHWIAIGKIPTGARIK